MAPMNSVQPKGNVGVHGELHIVVRGKDGEIKQEVRKKNLVVLAGLTLLANRISDSTPSSGCLINYIAVGTGVAAPDAANTALGTETARKQVTSRTNSGAVAAISTTFNAGDITPSTLKEVGMFIDGTGTVDSGTLFCRQAIDVAVTALDSVFVDWRVTFADA